MGVYRWIATLGFLALTVWSGCSAPPSTVVQQPVTPKGTPVVTPKVLSFAVSPENLNVDKVGLRDGYQKPDGARDLAFTASIQGTVDALFVISTNQKGEPVYGLRADSLIGNEEIPTELGGVIDTGRMTVGIAAVEVGKTVFVNGESGSIHLPDGLHNLTLYIPNTATLNPGSFVRVWVKAGDQLVPGPITPY